MQQIIFDSEYFNPQSVLECGQIFRFVPFKKGYLVFTTDKACYLYSENGKTIVEFENAEDTSYFYNYFDLFNDYGEIVKKAQSFNVASLSQAIEFGKGIRILRQNEAETFISFIISQNNFIPRIKSIIERICQNLGDKKTFMDYEYYTFPSLKKLAEKDEDFYFGLGAGYRAKFLSVSSKRLLNTDISELKNLNSVDLKKELKTFLGVSDKVADCVMLFGFNRTDSFPVDTWLEKVYRDEFNGKEKNRKKITEYFTDLFGKYSGYIQQYLFYCKRESDKKGG